MLEVLVFADTLEGAVGTPMYVAGGVGMVGDHVVSECCGLNGSVWTMFTLVHLLLGVLFSVSPQGIVIARPVAAMFACERFVTWKEKH